RPASEQYQAQPGKCLHPAGGSGHGGKEQDVEGDDSVDGKPYAHTRQNSGPRQSAESEESQEQAVASCAMRASQNGEQGGQRTRGQAEGSRPDQDRSHQRSAPDISQAGQHGIAHPSGYNLLDVGTLPAIQKKDYTEE